MSNGDIVEWLKVTGFIPEYLYLQVSSLEEDLRSILRERPGIRTGSGSGQGPLEPAHVNVTRSEISKPLALQFQGFPINQSINQLYLMLQIFQIADQWCGLSIVSARPLNPSSL
jgi:hypothetical protein